MAGKADKQDAALQLGAKIRNRHLNESGVIAGYYVNTAGTWYDIKTPGGMSVGWWHESDVDSAPRSRPPAGKRTEV
jgi:hypothetical protein